MSRLTYTADMAIEHTDTHPHAPEEHYCEHTGCNEWGGYGMARSRGEPVRWWCWAHYPYKEPGSARTGGALPNA